MAESDARIAGLIDRCRDLSAQLEGARMELALAVGDRDAARRHMREMYAQTEARHAARAAQGCYFMQEGDRARALAQEGPHA